MYRHKHEQNGATVSLSAELESALWQAGISRYQLATIIDVREETARRWVNDTQPVPEEVVEKVYQLGDFTEKVVAALVKYIDKQDAPVIATYRQNADMPRCDATWLGAAWWDNAVSRARATSRHGARNIPVLRHRKTEHPEGATITPELLNGIGIPEFVRAMRKKPEIGQRD